MEINQKFWNKFYLVKKEIKIPKPSSFGIFFNKKFVKKNKYNLKVFNSYKDISKLKKKMDHQKLL